MVALPSPRDKRKSWERAARLVLDGARADDITTAVEAALFLDMQLDLKATRKS